VIDALRLGYRSIVAVGAVSLLIYLLRHPPRPVAVRRYLVGVAALTAAYRSLIVAVPWLPNSTIRSLVVSGDISSMMWLLVILGVGLAARSLR
jgi:hypothetical protein